MACAGDPSGQRHAVFPARGTGRDRRPLRRTPRPPIQHARHAVCSHTTQPDPAPRTCIARSRSSQKRLTSPVAMPRTILASVRRLLSPRLPTPPSRGPSSLHSSASRRSSSLVVSRPLKRPWRWGRLGEEGSRRDRWAGGYVRVFRALLRGARGGWRGAGRWD